MEKGILVQMRLRNKTLAKLKNISNLTNVDNSAHLVASSIQLTELIVKSMKNGAKVYIEKPNGDTSTINFA